MTAARSTRTTSKRIKARQMANTSLGKRMVDFFPEGFKPRKIQQEALERIEAAFAKPDIDYVVLEAPPGVGKSHIGTTVARYFGKAYFATLTEQLQDQYVNLFGPKYDMFALKGRGKYHCDRANDTCKAGALLYTGRNACAPDMCPYKVAKANALAAALTVANYHSLLANLGTGPAPVVTGAPEVQLALDDEEESPIRPLMVLDEAHCIEAFLLDTVGFTVHLDKLQVPTPDLPHEERSVEPYVAWMQEVLPRVTERMKQLVDPEMKEDLRLLVGKMMFAVKAATAEPMDFIPERGTNSDGSLRKDWFALKPLRVAKYGRWVYGHGEKLLLMSATVLNAGQLVHSLGLDPARGDFIQMGSVFPKENRPIIVYPMDQRKNARDDSWPIVAELVERLLTHHAGQKGLLLCPSNEMLKFIRSKLERRNAERLIFAYGEERMARYNEHVRSKAPTVLAASGYWEGADLAGDASRFQIIPACPRPMWHGQIKARSQLDPKWYRWLTFTKMVQGYGRSIRSDTDEAVTYVFDQDFVREMKAKDTMLPPWVQEAVSIKTGAQTYEE